MTIALTLGFEEGAAAAAGAESAALASPGARRRGLLAELTLVRGCVVGPEVTQDAAPPYCGLVLGEVRPPTTGVADGVA